MAEFGVRYTFFGLQHGLTLLPTQTQRKLHHVNILRAVDSWKGTDHYYILLEMCDNVRFTLFDWLFFRFQPRLLAVIVRRNGHKNAAGTYYCWLHQAVYNSRTLIAKSVLKINLFLLILPKIYAKCLVVLCCDVLSCKQYYTQRHKTEEYFAKVVCTKAIWFWTSNSARCEVNLNVFVFICFCEIIYVALTQLWEGRNAGVHSTRTAHWQHR